jgi:hypothetical protein
MAKSHLNRDSTGSSQLVSTDGICAEVRRFRPQRSLFSQQRQRVHIHQHRGPRNLIGITKRQRPAQQFR